MSHISKVVSVCFSRWCWEWNKNAQHYVNWFKGEFTHTWLEKTYNGKKVREDL